MLFKKGRRSEGETILVDNVKVNDINFLHNIPDDAVVCMIGGRVIQQHDDHDIGMYEVLFKHWLRRQDRRFLLVAVRKGRLKKLKFAISKAGGFIIA